MTEKISIGQSGEDGWDTSDADTVPNNETTTEKRKWVADAESRIRDVKVLAECKCGKPRVRVIFHNGFSIDVHDDGSFIQWTGEM